MIVNEFELLHRASIDGWKAFEINKNLYGKSHALNIIHTDSDNVFGAFIKTTINKKNHWIADKDAFLFLLRSSKGYGARIFPIVQQMYAIYLYSGSAYFTIQYGSDIYITSNCNENNTAMVDACDYNLPGDTYINGGSKNFKITDMEFFTCS